MPYNNYINNPGAVNSGVVNQAAVNACQQQCGVFNDYQPRLEIANALGAVMGMIDNIQVYDDSGYPTVDPAMQAAKERMWHKANNITSYIRQQREQARNAEISEAMRQWNNINGNQPGKPVQRQAAQQGKANNHIAQPTQPVQPAGNGSSILDRYNTETCSDLPLFNNNSFIPVGNRDMTENDKNFIRDIMSNFNAKLAEIGTKLNNLEKTYNEIYDCLKAIHGSLAPKKTDTNETYLTFDDES